MRRVLATSGAKFLVVGFANTLVGLGAIWMAKWLLGAGDVLANVIGYGLGLALSFTLNRAWTFGYRGATPLALLRFLLVFAVAYMLNLSTVLAAIRFGHVDPYLAQAIGIVPYTAFGYLASRYFVFRRSREA